MDVCMVRLAVYLFGLIGGFLTPLLLDINLSCLWDSSGFLGIGYKKATQMRSFYFVFGWLDAEVFLMASILASAAWLAASVVGGCLHLATDFNVEFDLGFCSGRTDGYF